VPRVSVAAALAGRVLLSALRVRREFAGADHTVAMQSLPTPGVGYRGDDLSRHSHSPARVVSGHVVGDDAEEWRQRVGPATSLGTAEVRDRVDDAA